MEGWPGSALAALGVFGVVLLLLLQRRRRLRQVEPTARAAPLYAYAAALRGRFEESAVPADLAAYPEFVQGVTFLNGGDATIQDLIAYAGGDNQIVACMALEALRRRRGAGGVCEGILAIAGAIPPWPRYFALQALLAHAPQERSLVGPILLVADSSWTGRINYQVLQDFLAARLRAGEAPTFGTSLEGISEDHAAFLRQLLERLGEQLTGPLLAEFDAWQRTRIDFKFLRSVGRVWDAATSTDLGAVIEHEDLRRVVADLAACLVRPTPRSVLLVGESGVGKTMIVRALAERLQADNWVIFEASPAELVAGQIYYGQFEERLRSLVQQIGGKRRVLWIVPEFHGLMWAGRHEYRHTGALDFLLPHIEQGTIVLVGETHPVAHEKILVAKPRAASIFETRRISPLAADKTLQLVREWASRCTCPGHPDLLPEATLREAWHLAQQYLGDMAAPGNILKFLDLARRRLVAIGGEAACVIRPDDLIATLTQLTGLPESILDERQDLNLDALRQHFEKRVLGQPEAVDCLVERVAMIKAGVTDPTRPQGVFLFAGPTGTGKTEIAKTLAEFLFGSPNRMIRLDMSELQTPESLSRLLGDPERRADAPSAEGALVDQIRKQPFSLVLLDEFEKAHPNVWDIFLQVFDDGRLTDRRGNTADFRHAIIVMTTNLGGAIPSGTTLGFAKDGGRFRPDLVERAVAQAFRREFLNRIDRLVVFQPLGRETMREILLKELDEVTRRRGLRSRTWAIEWDDEAIEFLLTKGFTADLGARPLRRAIERYLLSPLAVTIVKHQYPEGDQFLFVKVQDDKLGVEFVDPNPGAGEAGAGIRTEDAAAGTAAPVEVPPSGAAGLPPFALESIAFDPHGTTSEAASLRHHYDRIRRGIDDAAWQDRKSNLLAMTGRADFWRSPDRFKCLGEAEYLDRVEQGLRSAGSLLDRLLGSEPGKRDRYPRDLVGRLAEQLYLLDMACNGISQGWPSEAFLLLEAGRDPGVGAARSNRFATQLGDMYRAWAKKRRMQLQVIDESGGDGKRPYRLLLAVSGFGAYPILRHEDGLHVLELETSTSDDKKRCKVRLRVVPQPDQPAGEGRDALRRQALQALREAAPARIAVVRRYRESPPLVRDRARGWRSAALERILGGDFDLIARNR
jgi:ATP-dependent Clp protease ATP-binding subunit ClpC